jgi:hypothetical protein
MERGLGTRFQEAPGNEEEYAINASGLSAVALAKVEGRGAP